MSLFTVTLPDSLTLHRATIDTQQLDQLIHDLALIRAKMQPPIPAMCAEQTNAPIQTAPQIEVSASTEGITLALRHFGFGWCIFTLPLKQAAFLRDALIKRIGREPVHNIEEQPPNRKNH
jgi:hypothetical protein